MLKTRSFVRKTRRGRVVKVVREHYLRDDLPCGVAACAACPAGGVQQPVLDVPPRAASALAALQGRGYYLVPDTNVVYHQIDLIEHKSVCRVVVLQTVLDELGNRSMPVYKRLRTVIADPARRFHVFCNEHHYLTHVDRQPKESPNDRNDRAIRTATKWYEAHLAKIDPELRVVLLTDDAENRRRARAEGLLAFSVREYVDALANGAELGDIVAAPEDDAGEKFQYDEYLSPLALQAGLKAGSLIQGTLQISTHNFMEGSLFAPVDGEERAVRIHGRANLNRAVHGDSIIAELLPRDQWRTTPSAVVMEESEEKAEERIEKQEQAQAMQVDTIPAALPCAKVVGILKRNWRPYCGTIDKQSVDTRGPATRTQFVLFVPMDRRVPKIRIRTRQAPNLVGQRIIVSVDAWGITSMYPSGHYCRTLGSVGDRSTETEVLLLEHEVPFAPFAPQVLADLPPAGESWTASADDLVGRADFRALNVCSIDPPGCTDIDDALHARPLPNGNYEVGVHIADVTHFVKPETAMDKEATERGTTVYLVDKRIDMLPGLLGTSK